MTEKQFEKYLMLYGSSIENWPDDIQAEAMQASCDPRMSALMMRHCYFEDKLRRCDEAVPPANPWLADRIINAAGNRTPAIGIMARLQELLAAVLPQPAFALATVLTLGIVIGFSLPASKNDNTQPSYFEDAAL